MKFKQYYIPTVSKTSFLKSVKNKLPFFESKYMKVNMFLSNGVILKIQLNTMRVFGDVTETKQADLVTAYTHMVPVSTWG